MVAQLRERGIRDERVLRAFAEMPRHLFVSESLRHLAYSDHPLPIAKDQTISQPYVVALMLQALQLSGTERVLEIGTGSGYEAALLGRLAGEVHSIERFAELAEQASRVLVQVGAQNVSVHVGDGSVGLAAHAPYDAIISSAAAPQAPRPWLQQLTEGGRLLLPVGEPGEQVLQLWTRRGDEFTHRQLGTVAFVPLIGKHGWADDQS